ncbi:N-6 DNA methylase [Anaerolineales bacterium HSG24]|nr:N-6 DNA methylase [Anaerolineales bacterium HSG24]
MSQKDIQTYYSKLDQYQRFGGSRNESNIRRAFANLLEAYCTPKNLILVDELTLKDSLKRPDGTVKDALRLDWGHWESKDTKDKLHDKIAEKIAKGYPTFNIIFEDSQTIVLMQQGMEVLRGNMQDADLLNTILTEFVSYERPEIQEFRHAIEQFKEDIPDIVEALRGMIAKQAKSNADFRNARADFWQLCKDSINPDISEFDIREMLIQHILTHEIFSTIFDEMAFHRENNIAMQLDDVVNTFFTGKTRRNTLAKIDNYYKTIKREAANIANHHEKQRFLKMLYENFYKAYNPKGADRLGIVYTPNEIVRFMIKSVDHLLDKHFETSLHEKGVDILDPATGTGTFITDLIEYMPKQYLEYKYLHEIHANEVSILPYYIANLNIEYTYQQKMNDYQPFEHIVFVDTLDNMGFKFHGKQGVFEGFGMSAENLTRIKEQNKRTISVIIGNPPYNANQMNENDNNKNREYWGDPKKKGRNKSGKKGVDDRIKDTYIDASTAQKTKMYDMYSRFIRWATDRVDNNGIVAFITNRSYLDTRTFDGFRKTVAQEVDFIYVVDTKSDVRKNPKIAGTTHNVFGIQAGVAVIFLIKKTAMTEQAKIHYFTLTDDMFKAEKLTWFQDTHIGDIAFERIRPDKHTNWLNISDNDFDDHMPVCDKEVKLGRSDKAIFGLFINGVVTARDEWVYDFNQQVLEEKIKYMIDKYNSTLSKSVT